MIRAINITKSYGDLHVLTGVNLEVNKGEIVSIVGASGAGKSTLLHILGTLDKADLGSVTFGEQKLEDLSEKELARFRNLHIGFIFQFHHLLPEFDAVENICMPALIARRSHKEARMRAEELLEILGLSDRR